MSRRPRRLPVVRVTLALVGALLLAGCAPSGPDDVADGSPAPSVPAASPSPSLSSPSLSSPSPSPSPASPSPGDTAAAPESATDDDRFPDGRVEAEGVSVAPGIEGLCSQRTGCVEAMMEFVPAAEIPAGTTVVVSMSFAPDQVVVRPVDGQGSTTLEPIRATEDGVEVDWEVEGPGNWRISATTGDDPDDPGTPSATWRLEVVAPTAASAEFDVADPGIAWTLPDGTIADPGDGLDDWGDGVKMAAGSPTCDWDDAALLHLPWPLDTEVIDTDDLRQYVWDPAGQLEELGITRDRRVDDVPETATDTGFHTDHQQLWLGDDANDFAYLVADSGEVRRLQRSIVRPGGILSCG